MIKEYIDDVVFPETGYQPIIDFESWRVAVLKHCDDLKPENLETLQKHMLTDEVFVLVSGTCNLYAAGNGDEPGQIMKVPMEYNRGYNVRKGVWHTHTLSEDAVVLIVENQNTCDENSPVFKLTKEMKDSILALEFSGTVNSI